MNPHLAGTLPAARAARIILSEAAMKRHASLHPLSQHHHFALMQALFMRRAAEAPASRRAAAVR